MVFKVSECIWELKIKKNQEKSEKESHARLGEQKIEDQRAANREIAQNIGPTHANMGSIGGQRMLQKGDRSFRPANKHPRRSHGEG